MSLLRFSPWKSRSALLPPPAGGSPEPSLGTKLFIEAHASNSVPSTEKCSSDNNALTLGWASRACRNFLDTSASSNRSRFLVNTVTSHTGSSTDRPMNHRKSRLYSSCSINWRSERIV